MIKPIQTLFNGIAYRSRLEARWAVFFYLLGIEYHYEQEGYQVNSNGKTTNYLPDFYLPNVGVRGTAQTGWYIEVKPTGNYNDKLDVVCAELGSNGLLVAGGSVSHEKHYQLGEYRDDNMNFRHCDECGHVAIGYGHKQCTCVKCGGGMSFSWPAICAQQANSYKFEFCAMLPWPVQVVADEINVF